MSRKLTFMAINQIAHDLIVDFGADYVYPKIDNYCCYVEQRVDADVPLCPSCAIGHMLHRFGVPIGALATLDNVGVGPVTCLIIHTLPPGRITLDPPGELCPGQTQMLM